MSFDFETPSFNGLKQQNFNFQEDYETEFCTYKAISKAKRYSPQPVFRIQAGRGKFDKKKFLITPGFPGVATATVKRWISHDATQNFLKSSLKVIKRDVIVQIYNFSRNTLNVFSTAHDQFQRATYLYKNLNL